MKLNLKPSPPDLRDFRLTLLPQKPLPSSVDLSSKMTSVKDQGSVGSCTAFAAVSMYEHLYRGATSDTTQDVFSEKFLYYVTRVRVAGWDAKEDSGAYLRDTLSALVKHGVCKEPQFPYLKPGQTSSSFEEVPPTSAYTEALKFQALTYQHIPEGTNGPTRQQALTTLKTLLSDGYTFIGGFICYDNLFSATQGVVPLPQGTSKIIGGHAVCFVGYDDAKQQFKFKNSWGLGWGDRGYGYLPYQYLLSGDLFDLWSITTAENNNLSISIVKKKPTRKELITDALNNGLIAIGNGTTPVVTGLTPADTNLVRSLLNRVISLKNQTIPRV